MPRMLILAAEGPVVVPVEEIDGIHRLDPALAVAGRHRFTAAVLQWRGRSVRVLDDQHLTVCRAAEPVMTPEQMRDASLLELFSLEAEAQTQVLSAGLMALERNPTQADQLEACMRAAHSLKGAARIVGIDAGVSVAHVMEDCLVAAQEGRLLLRRAYRRAVARHRPADAHRHAGRSGEATLPVFLAQMASLLDPPPSATLVAPPLPAATPPAMARRRRPWAEPNRRRPEPSPCGARPASAVARAASGCCGSPPTA
jgi:two-component system sensor histidine kinase and response regulator WspE